MDPVSSNNSQNVRQAYAGADVIVRKLPSSSKVESSSVSLIDLDEYAKKAVHSGDDLRSEVIKKAKMLIEDPNWLSDKNIDDMVTKLISSDDF